MKHLISIVFALYFLLFLVGCGGYVGLNGRVVYSDTNEPLECGTVNFTAGNFCARGEINADGRFTVGSYKENDGLPPGQYVVYITNAQRTEESSNGGMPRFIPLIDRKYGNAATSGLAVTVDGTQKTFDISVDRVKAKQR